MIIGIDAGGTTTTAVAMQGDTILATVTGGTGNFKRIGLEGASMLVRNLVQQLREITGTAPEALCAGFAGAGNSDDRVRLKRLFEEELGIPCRIETDASIALHGAFDGAPGMLLIAGTGSIAYGKSERQSDPIRVGGWGWMIGDEGSGSWLGREAVRCIMLAYDGRGEATELTKPILDYLQLNGAFSLIPLLYSSEWTPAKFGELAPIVLDTAANDPVARRLVRLAASHLARHLAVLQDRIGDDPLVRHAVFSGGLIANKTLLRDELLAELDHIGTIEISEARYSPHVGAARMVYA